MKKIQILFMLLIPLVNTYSQIDSSAQSFFPCNVGDSWFYKYAQDLGYVTTITRDSIANGKRFLFYDSSAVPSFEVDTLINIWSNPTNDNYRSLEYKLNANVGDTWIAQEIGGGYRITARLEEVLWNYYFNILTQVKRIGYYYQHISDTTLFDVWRNDYFIGAGFGFCLEITDAMQDPARWLEGCIISGITYGQMTAVKNIESVQHPSEFVLYPAYPNPFNPITSIRYQLPEKSRIKLTISDLLGREIAMLVDSEQNKGTHTVTWNASKYSSGVYLCQLKTKRGVQTQKIAFVK